MAEFWLLGCWTVAVLVGMSVRLYNHRNLRWLLGHWRHAASEAGLTSIEEFRSSVTGYSGTIFVRLTRFDEEKGHGTHVEIGGPGLAPGLTLDPEPWAVFSPEPNPREIEIGDAAERWCAAPSKLRAMSRSPLPAGSPVACSAWTSQATCRRLPDEAAVAPTRRSGFTSYCVQHSRSRSASWCPRTWPRGSPRT